MPDPKREPDDKEQSQRFIEKVRDVADKDADEAFDRAFRTIIPPRPTSDEKSRESAPTPESHREI